MFIVQNKINFKIDASASLSLQIYTVQVEQVGQKHFSVIQTCNAKFSKAEWVKIEEGDDGL